MRRLIILLAAFCLIGLALAVPVAAQSGVSVTCDNGTSFDNGVEVTIVQMRTGFEYTATAIGLNGFDPVLAVLDPSGRGLCTDDDGIAAGYTANLPTTGNVPASNTSSQVRFSNNGANAFQDISLVVGGYNNTPGEFILVLEGMAVTDGDGTGDPFSIQITPGMINSGVPLTAYMISRENTLDPTVYQIDGDYNYVLDSAGNYVYCDDAGDANTCWGTSFNLSSSFVTVEGGTRLPGFQYDSMITIPLDASMQGGYINLASTSYQQSTYGKYFMVFHMGNNPGAVVQSGKNNQVVQQPTLAPAPVQPNNAGTASGMSVTCDNGGSFDNGVEVQVNMRSGFTYTATAVGLNGFDPVLAVLNADTGSGLCTDDDSIAARYTANLPTSGLVPASNLSSQVRFDYNGAEAFGNISLVVGGFQNTSGEFLLIFEGMAVTDNDGDGDPFAVNLTPGMVSSGVPLTIYMISRENSLDSMVNMVDPNGNLFFDSSNLQVYCDDAGNAGLCYGTSFDLSSSSVTTEGGQLPGFQYDSMLTLPLAGLSLNPDRTQNYFNFRMTSAENTRGQYVTVFHIGMSSAFTPSA